MDRVSPHRVPSQRGQAAGSEPLAVRSPAMPAGYRPKGVIGSEAGHAKPGRGGIRPEELRQLSENRHAYPERRSGRLRAAGVLASRLGMRTRPGTWPQRSFSSGSRSLTERSLPVDESPALGSMTGVIRLLLRVDVPASWTCEMRRRCSQGAVGALLRLCQCASGPPSHEVGREPAQLVVAQFQISSSLQPPLPSPPPRWGEGTPELGSPPLPWWERVGVRGKPAAPDDATWQPVWCA